MLHRMVYLHLLHGIPYRFRADVKGILGMGGESSPDHFPSFPSRKQAVPLSKSFILLTRSPRLFRLLITVTGIGMTED